MTLALNNASSNPYPSVVQAFCDGGSLAHMALGLVAGSDVLTSKEAGMALAVFTGYQLSQAETGEPFSRIGGELMEFAFGMFLARFLPS